MIRIAISSEPRLLNILRSVVKFRAQEAGVSKSNAEYLALAIDEAASNVIRHAYRGRCDALLALEVHNLPDGPPGVHFGGFGSQGLRGADPPPPPG